MLASSGLSAPRADLATNDDRLTRDELQGVIGLEFGHLLNGDMRLNIRIMGVMFCIVCLAVIGRVLTYSRGSVGACIDSPHVDEVNHIFFENGPGLPAFGWPATHWPLAERIRAIEPGWDGHFDRACITPGVDRAPAVRDRWAPPGLFFNPQTRKAYSARLAAIGHRSSGFARTVEDSANCLRSKNSRWTLTGRS